MGVAQGDDHQCTRTLKSFTFGMVGENTAGSVWMFLDEALKFACDDRDNSFEISCCMQSMLSHIRAVDTKGFAPTDGPAVIVLRTPDETSIYRH